MALRIQMQTGSQARRQSELSRCRYDVDATFFGYSMLDALRSLSTHEGLKSSVLWMCPVDGGYLLSVFEEGSHGELVLRLYAATSRKQLCSLVDRLVSRNVSLGIVDDGDLWWSLGSLERPLEVVSHRVFGELSSFRSQSLGRVDLFESDFRDGLFAEAYHQGGLCSSRALELVMSDIMALLLCGPPSSTATH